MSKKVENFIEEAKNNITEDRAATKTLLMNLMKYMQVADDRHREVGLVAAKYLETLQRSNEQLVKLAALVQKDTATNQNITEEDKKELFDLINASSATPSTKEDS
jgi:predicted patatin/cPLA2 family phospholipase